MYVIIWRFDVRSDSLDAFASEYGPHGTWGRFFRNGAGYVRTDLYRDVFHPESFVTIDYWDSKTSYDDFAAANREEYAAIDRRFEALTRDERKIAAFEQ